MAKQPYNFTNDTSIPERRKKSVKQEKKWAEKVKGKTQPASGALSMAKGDVKEKVVGFLEEFLWENKQTTHKSYGLSINTWNDIRLKAYSQGNIPGMQIEFHQHDIPALPKPLRLVVLAEEDFLFLREMAEKYKEMKGVKDNE